MANPTQVTRLMTRLQEELGSNVELSLHIHNTRGLGFANVLAGLQVGIDIARVMEASRIMEDFLGRRLPSHVLFSGTNQQSFERHRAR